MSKSTLFVAGIAFTTSTIYSSYVESMPDVNATEALELAVADEMRTSEEPWAAVGAANGVPFAFV
jgi:hypothetical protein